jgi:hypothetical protein
MANPKKKTNPLRVYRGIRFKKDLDSWLESRRMLPVESFSACVQRILYGVKTTEERARK